MRFLLPGFLLGISIIASTEGALAPDSGALHKLYGDSVLVSLNRTGNPDSESFILPGDIHLTVMYGSDHYACSVKLEPALPSNDQRKYHQMSSKRVTEILEEIAPFTRRGKLLGGGTVCGGSPGIGMEEYESVSIRRLLRCGESDSEAKATMNFKREVCPKP